MTRVLSLIAAVSLLASSFTAQSVFAQQTAFLSDDEGPRLYLYAWGLVYYLTFERSLVPSPRLDEYVAPAVANGPGTPSDAAGRFEHYVDAPLAEFEPRWRKSILSLRAR